MKLFGFTILTRPALRRLRQQVDERATLKAIELCARHVEQMASADGLRAREEGRVVMDTLKLAATSLRNLITRYQELKQREVPQ